MIAEVAHQLLDAGLIQFGHFNSARAPTPFLVSLDMLSSYPNVLRALVKLATELLSPMRAERILCTLDAVPFGVGLSLGTNIPLVFSRGTNEAPVHALVGAYDTGHPALVVTNILSDFKPLSQIVSTARRVGLDVHKVVAIVDLGIASLPQDAQVVSLVRLPDLVADLAGSDQLPPKQGRAILDWITARSREDSEISG